MTIVVLPNGSGTTGSALWSEVFGNDNAIAQVLNGDIRNDNLAAAGLANIAHNKLANATAGKLLIANAGGVITATAMSGDVTNDSAGVTAIGAGKVTSTHILDGTIVNADINGSAAINGLKLASGSVTDGQLTSPNNATYATLLTTAGVLSGGPSANTYLLGSAGAASRMWGSGEAITVNTTPSPTGPDSIRFVSSDHAVNGLTTKLLVRVEVAVNATAPAINYTAGLYPLTVAGGSGILNFTAGTVVTGSTAAVNAPGASGTSVNNSGDFDVPSAGQYGIAVVTSGAMAANSAVLVSAQLLRRNV
ncbi:MAG: hypothetical protein ACRDMH_03285 [Solirubrobacterales bacterium]